MRILSAGLIMLTALLISGTADAKGHTAYPNWYQQHRHYVVTSYKYKAVRRHCRCHARLAHRWRAVRVTRVTPVQGTLPGPCRVAASMGGPCGCWAAYVLLGKLDHVWRGINLWLANDWLRFPHVEPEKATAVVWPNRHVAPVVPGTYRNGTVVVRDSWATHRVRTAGLIFVQAPSSTTHWGHSVPL